MDTFFIGVDPAYKGPNGVAVIKGHRLIYWKQLEVVDFGDVVAELIASGINSGSYEMLQGVTEREMADKLRSFRESGDSIVLFVEDWKISRNFNTAGKLMSAQQRWIDAAELLGITWFPVQMVEWRKRFGLNAKKFTLNGHLKDQAVNIARTIFGEELPDDAAEAALIAEWGQRYWDEREVEKPK